MIGVELVCVRLRGSRSSNIFLLARDADTNEGSPPNCVSGNRNFLLRHISVANKVSTTSVFLVALRVVLFVEFLFETSLNLKCVLLGFALQFNVTKERGAPLSHFKEFSLLRSSLDPPKLADFSWSEVSAVCRRRLLF